MHRTSTFVASLTALSILATACGGDDGDTTPSDPTGGSQETTTTAGAEAPSGEADPNGVLRVGFNFLRSGSYSLDPRLYNGNNASLYLYQLFAPLVKVDPSTLEYTPYLAESFEIVDPQTLSVTIRSEATFHDGRPVTAADAKASIETTKANQADALNNVSASIQTVESVEVVDDHTFTVHFTQPAVLTMYALLVGPEFLISPADAGPEQSTTPVGNGPFAHASGAQDQSFSLTKYAEFFDADAIQLAGIDYTNLVEGNAQVNALLAGDIDFATDIATAGYEALEGRDGATPRAITDATRYLYLTFCAAPGHFWENPDLIAAVKRATDREQINEVLYNGLGAAQTQFFPVGHPYHDPALDEEFGYDIDAAEALATELPDPPTDGTWTPASLPESEDLALLLNEQWAGIGISTAPVLSDDLTGDALQPSKTDPPTLEGGDSLVIENTRAGLQRLTRQIDAASIVNTCNYSNDRLSEIALEIAAIAPDDPQAAVLWKEASRIVLEEAPFMIMSQKPSFVGLGSKVGGVTDSAFRGSSEGSFQYSDWYIIAD